MSLEYVILSFSCIILLLLLLFYVPKNKVREAWVIFLFKQVMTWILGLVIVEYRLLSYPVRFFPYSTKTSFTFEYFAYPAICVFFNLYYPVQKNFFKIIIHYFTYSSAITLFEVILEKYTQIIKYTGWAWYWTWLSILITSYITRKYYKWFFRIE